MRAAATLVRASWLAVRRPMLVVPLAAALLLLAATLPVQDRHPALVLHGLAVLLAAACAAGTDDPAGEVVAASPYPLGVRAGLRLGLVAVVAAPVWLVGLRVVQHRGGDLPAGVLTLEMAGLAAVAVSVGAGLRTWTGRLYPSYLAVVGTVVAALSAYSAPERWQLVDVQPWGPPLEAAMVRWAAVLLLAAGVLWAALRDPLASTPGRTALAPRA